MIVIRKQVLLAVMLLALMAGLFAAGWAHTSFEDGQALLLTREVQAIQVYLARARHWRTEIADQNEGLRHLFAADLEDIEATPTPGVAGLATPQPASGHPTRLYARSEQARRAREALLTVQREMEATAVPPSLIPTHEQAQQALGAALGLAERTLEYVGAPTAERLEQLGAQWELAARTWEALDQALGE